ncbi:hypothetical protein HN371_01240 [Candidatus Poribacteria bacterium]|jgi:hypothetical protein|nr:hypothetical protein [Candidatus Poribacteria bacterium]MBT5532178.1 hypothetical protein [Candidatus Poribacteria bacterium]MBT5712229.1 hypothetical protein [Candidatus Poribacteria bacterium]MBT7096648.1 hypothetical protein [Candidatus Poribacteria bacterium]MBT7804245.1 hypothetical protein [Candidatus Poribacteria bacterium]
MDIFDMPPATPHTVSEGLHWAFRSSRVLHVATELDLFTRLTDGPLSAAEIAAVCGADAAETEKLVICCCALGLLRKTDGRYSNTQAAEDYLVRGAPLYQGNMIAHAEHLWQFWSGLGDVVRTGDRGASGPPGGGDGHRDFILAMHNTSITGPARMVAENVDLSGARRLLDIGGGPGTFSIALCQKHAGLTADLFDRPATLEVAREVIERFGMADRIRLVEGDWDQEDYGDGYDAALFSNVLHGAASGAPEKLRKGFEALNEGGQVVVHDFLLNNQKTGPLGAALFGMMVGAYSTDEMCAVVEAAGFVEVRLVAVNERGAGVVVGRKP